MLLTACICACGASAQKVLRPVRTQLKARNGGEALKAVQNLEKDSVASSYPRLYQMGMQAYMLQNDVENEKIYLKQSFDSLSFFNSTYGIYAYALKCDSAERASMTDASAKYRFRRENAEILLRYWPNLRVGADFFYTRKSYADAIRFYAMTILVSDSLAWTGLAAHTESAYPVKAAFRHLQACYASGRYAEVPRYKDLALRDSSCRAVIWEYLAHSAAATGDTALSLDYLGRGLEEYPETPYFFTNLADYYARHNEYDRVLAMADTLLKNVSTNLVFLEGKSLALLNLRRFPEAIAVAQHCLAVDSTLKEANYYIGASYCNQATDVELPTNINSRAYRNAYAQRKEFYRKALPYVERYRELAPERQAQWAPLLYNIYLNLNLGRQFEEIDRLLKQ